MASIGPHICYHTYDVVIVGAGGAGMRAALGMSSKNLKTACLSKVFPTRSHTVSAQGGIAAALNNMGDGDSWQDHFYDTVKGSDWLGDQDAIAIMCAEGAEAIIELEHMGVPFSRTATGHIYQRLFGGHTRNKGKQMAARACAAADRTGHAILHTLYQQCLKHNTTFYIEYVAIDLIMDEKGRCSGVVAWCLEDGTLHIFQAHLVVLATGGAGRTYASCTAAHMCTGDGAGMAVRAGLPLQDMEFVQFHPTGIYGVGALITEAVRGEGGYLLNNKGERFMERYAPHAKDLASRDVVSRALAIEIQEGRGCGENNDYIELHLAHLGADAIHARLGGIVETAKRFANVDVTSHPIPVVPTAHYNMGGIPTNTHGEVIRHVVGSKVETVPGLMAIGEAACVSVHGANRLGANSLLDLIVFGKRAAEKAALCVRPQTAHAPLPKIHYMPIIDRFESLRQGGDTLTTAELRTRMQKIMQKHVGVFRDGKTLNAGKKELARCFADLPHVTLADKSRIWNTDLMELLELHNLMLQALTIVHSATRRTESRGSHARADYPRRDDYKWLKHTLCYVHPNNEECTVTFANRKVILSPTIGGVHSIPPVARMY
ncbi:MAG: succinate dehydrogenase flavoprotein subunit [Alphaproteobacteria bacterium]|nr:MAG: succinate dehydrogenase flavoprotein subunit [Alphaproteobacteria bacterium]